MTNTITKEQLELWLTRMLFHTTKSEEEIQKDLILGLLNNDITTSFLKLQILDQ